jgi:capsular exopolysaccharide synthesis family protein
MPQDASFPDRGGNVPPSRHDGSSNPPSNRPGTRPVAGRIDPARRALVSDAHTAAVPAALSSAPELGTYLRALGRRWVAAAALGGTLAILAGLAAWFLMSPEYIAFAKVRVAFESPSFGTGPQTGGKGDFFTYLKTQAAQIMSRPVIWSALKRDEVKRLNLDSLGDDPIQFIDKKLKVEVQDNQELVTITLGAHDPQISLGIVKAIVDAYMDDIVYAETRAREAKVAQLDKAFTAASASLKQKQDSLAVMAKKPGNTDPQLLALRLSELQSRIRDATVQQSGIRLNVAQAQADLASHEARMKAVKEAVVSDSGVLVALKADAKAQAFQAQITRCQAVIDDFEQKTPGQSWPSLTAARHKMKTLQVKYKDRKKELQEELAQHTEASGTGGREELELARVQKANLITALKQRDQELEADIVALNKQLAETKLADHDSDSLRDAIKQEEQFVNELSLKLRKEQVELMAGSRVSKAQDAELQKKDMKKQLMVTAVAPLVVLLAVCMGLAWTEVRHRRIRSAGEVSRGLGIRVVGAVPNLPHLIGPTGEPDLEGHPALESIDAIRTLLLRNADSEATRVVMVTSATTGEGKTTVASHLASSLARAGRKTLLIDGDLRTPSAHQLFELPMHPGLSEVLLAEVELTDAVQATTLDGLSFMAAGQWDREVLQALARDGLEGIFEKLQEEFDFVVIDSHPVLPATDSLLIGQRVDAVILSVLREVSQMPRVYAASQRLSTLGIHVMGAVVNGADPEEALAATASARLVAH